jgi:hypothetical protein
LKLSWSLHRETINPQSYSQSELGGIILILNFYSCFVIGSSLCSTTLTSSSNKTKTALSQMNPRKDRR